MTYVMTLPTPRARTVKQVGKVAANDCCARLDKAAPTTYGTSHT